MLEAHGHKITIYTEQYGEIHCHRRLVDFTTELVPQGFFQASAIFYSLAATASANGLNVEQYFTSLFSHIPNAVDSPSTLPLLPFAHCLA